MNMHFPYIIGDMLEFKVNEYITLKLKANGTFIYIKNQEFRQCVRLVLQIPKKEIEKYDEIDSIDEAAKIFKTLHKNRIIEGGDIHDITPEQEFRGHCSNIQAWAENNYDTRIIHSNLAFPLLRKLFYAGDPLAKKYLKEEVAKRFECRDPNVIRFIINERYFNIFNKEELHGLVFNEKGEIKEFLQNLPEENSKSILFPLLGRLTEMEDAQALVIYKDLITQDMQSGNPITIQHLLNRNYLDFFKQKELNSLVFKENGEFQDYLKEMMEDLEFSRVKTNVTTGYSLLKILTNKRVPLALSFLKDRLTLHIRSGNIDLIQFLTGQGFLDMFNRKELKSLVFKENGEYHDYIKSTMTVLISTATRFPYMTTGFVILNKLSKMGETIARKIILNEFAIGFKNRNKFIIDSFLQGYFNHLKEDEKKAILDILPIWELWEYPRYNGAIKRKAVRAYCKEHGITRFSKDVFRELNKRIIHILDGAIAEVRRNGRKTVSVDDLKESLRN